MSVIIFDSVKSSLVLRKIQNEMCDGCPDAKGEDNIVNSVQITNTAAISTLNVNSAGAKSIYCRNAAISAGYLMANGKYKFVYDGTQYELIGDINIDTNTTCSNMTAASKQSQFLRW